MRGTLLVPVHERCCFNLKEGGKAHTKAVGAGAKPVGKKEGAQTARPNVSKKVPQNPKDSFAAKKENKPAGIDDDGDEELTLRDVIALGGDKVCVHVAALLTISERFRMVERLERYCP